MTRTNTRSTSGMALSMVRAWMIMLPAARNGAFVELNLHRGNFHQGVDELAAKDLGLGLWIADDRIESIGWSVIHGADDQPIWPRGF